MIQWNLTATIMQDPEQLHEQGISDHAPVCVVCQPRRRRPAADQAVLRFVCEPLEYKESLELLMSQSLISRLAPIPKWRELKRLMREAARMARNSLARASTPCLESRRMIFRSISRTVHFDDLKLARTLLGKTTEAGEHLLISEGPCPDVRLKDQIARRRQYEQLQRDILNIRLARAQEAAQDQNTPFMEVKRLRAYMRAERRRGKLWAPKGKTLPLPGPSGPRGRDPHFSLSDERCLEGALGPRFLVEKFPREASEGLLCQACQAI